MKTVIQEDENGCWLACVSMLTGEPYEELRSLFTFRGEVTGRSAGPVKELLASLGYSCDEKSTPIRKVDCLASLKSNALVYFKNIDNDGSELGGHWMVWDHKEKAMRDPEGWKPGSCFKIKNFRRVVKRT